MSYRMPIEPGTQKRKESDEAICRDIDAVFTGLNDPILGQWVEACQSHSNVSSNDSAMDIDLYFTGRRLIEEAQLRGAIDQAKYDRAMGDRRT